MNDAEKAEVADLARKALSKLGSGEKPESLTQLKDNGIKFNTKMAINVSKFNAPKIEEFGK